MGAPCFPASSPSLNALLISSEKRSTNPDTITTTRLSKAIAVEDIPKPVDTWRSQSRSRCVQRNAKAAMTNPSDRAAPVKAALCSEAIGVRSKKWITIRGQKTAKIDSGPQGLPRKKAFTWRRLGAVRITSHWALSTPHLGHISLRSAGGLGKPEGSASPVAQGFSII